MIVGSPRQALAYLYAHHRGPKSARPQYGHVPADTGRSHWDGSLIGAMLYGPRVPELGQRPGCGIVSGSVEDAEVQRWATNVDEHPNDPDKTLRTPLVLSVERRMRTRLRAEGLMLSRRPPPKVLRWKDPENRVWASLVLAGRLGAISRCASVQEVAQNP